MSSTRASIIVCVYNRGHEILDCLESLRRLTFRDFEIVLVDDGSTDDTPRILHRFAESHPELSVRIVTNPRNRGVSAARNAGIDVARGEVIFFTDSDCTVAPDHLEQMVSAFDQSDVAAVAGKVITPAARSYADQVHAGTDHVDNTAARRPLIGCNMGFRAEVLRMYRFDPALVYVCDEEDIAWRMRTDGHRFAFVERAVVHHNHWYTTRSLLRKARSQGMGSARLWYKQGRYLGLDILPLVLAFAALPLGLFDGRLLVLPAILIGLQAVVLLYNEAMLKGKGPLRALHCLPLAFVASLVKAASVLQTHTWIARGKDREIIQSKREWLARTQRAATAGSAT